MSRPNCRKCKKRPADVVDNAQYYCAKCYNRMKGIREREPSNKLYL
jgi:tRNA(Ile2) C34 agmatinyltransferase TiaS